MDLPKDSSWARQRQQGLKPRIYFGAPSARVNSCPDTKLLAEAAIALLVLCLIAGCNVGPKYNPPTAPAVSAYTPQALPGETASSTGAAGVAQRFDSAASISAQWWTLFHSPELNGMMELALANSPTLAQAAARLKEAQEELNGRTGATKYPTVTGNASVEGEQLNLAAYGIPFPNPSPFALLNGSVAVSYALDIFGANRRAIEGLGANRDYERWQLEGARLMLAGFCVGINVMEAADIGALYSVMVALLVFFHALSESSGTLVKRAFRGAVRVAVVPAPHDPDSLIKESGGAAFKKLIEENVYDYPGTIPSSVFAPPSSPNLQVCDYVACRSELAKRLDRLEKAISKMANQIVNT